jgi:prepilin signal peptidase PulO-like enzyme (type II secretory pathway)
MVLALSTRSSSPLEFWSAVLISSIFLLIVIIDLEHRLILHVVTGPSALIIGTLGILNPSRGWEKTLQGGAGGLLLVYGLYLMGILFARLMARARNEPLDEVAFGFGDVTLAGVIGLVVGWPGVIVALFIGIFLGGLYSLGYLVVSALRRSYSAFTPIPYSPFLVAGALLVYLGGRSVLANLFR